MRRNDKGIYKRTDKELDDLLDVTVDPNVTEFENDFETPAGRATGVLATIPWDEYNFTAKQRAFIDYYCADPTNATRAALNAGYSPTTAAKEACLALKRPDIGAVIATVMNSRIERTQLTRDKVLHELEVLMTANIDDFAIGEDGRVVVAEGRPKYLIKAVKNVEFVVENVTKPDGSTVVKKYTKVWLYNKEAILRMAGQYHKMYTDVTDHHHQGEVTTKHVWQVGDKEITF
jgi:phage terminase small subunit